MSGEPLFGFTQFEFGHLLGPGDGRFIVRPAAEPGRPAEEGLAAHPEAVLVLRTLGAPERRLLRGRRGRAVEEAAPEPVPTSRATVIRPNPFSDRDQAGHWLAGLRADHDAADAEVAVALGVLNRALHAHRAARADPSPRDVGADSPLVTRIGFGAGEAVAEGRFAQAWELPRQHARTRRSMEAPEERFAALLGGREPILACEELVLRARADLDAGRPREAALQARVALESLLAELPEIPGERRPALEEDRAVIAQAANAALHGSLPATQAEQLAAAVARMEAALRARRLGSAG